MRLAFLKDEAVEGCDRLVAVKQLRPGGSEDERTIIAVVRFCFDKMIRALTQIFSSRDWPENFNFGAPSPINIFLLLLVSVSTLS